MQLLHNVKRNPHVAALVVAGAIALAGATPAVTAKPMTDPVVQPGAAQVLHRHAQALARVEARVGQLQAEKVALRNRVHELKKEKRAWMRWGKEWRRTARRAFRTLNTLRNRIGGWLPPALVSTSGYRGYTIVRLAAQHLGDPYVFGAAGPNAFDCSGLVRYCYAKLGIYLAHSATAQQRASRQIALSALRAGDLVFYGGYYRSYHVAIYVGNGRTIEATDGHVQYGWVGRAWTGGTFFH